MDFGHCGIAHPPQRGLEVCLRIRLGQHDAGTRLVDMLRKSAVAGDHRGKATHHSLQDDLAGDVEPRRMNQHSDAAISSGMSSRNPGRALCSGRCARASACVAPFFRRDAGNQQCCSARTRTRQHAVKPFDVRLRADHSHTGVIRNFELERTAARVSAVRRSGRCRAGSIDGCSHGDTFFLSSPVAAIIFRRCFGQARIWVRCRIPKDSASSIVCTRCRGSDRSSGLRPRARTEGSPQ